MTTQYEENLLKIILSITQMRIKIFIYKLTQTTFQETIQP